MNKKINHGQITIKVDHVTATGKGAIILTGPSSCGKGEIAKELRRFLDLPKTRHLSMGDMLRRTIHSARVDQAFKSRLASVYEIDAAKSIFDHSNMPEVIEKAYKYKQTLKEKYGDFVSQLDWLEFCVSHGLLIPDNWTVNIINATFDNADELKDEIFIIDGYPRTVKAAEALIETFIRFKIPVIKVIHLSITKEEMMRRALGRNRPDDRKDSLERRYAFYVENVQPSIDYLKDALGSHFVSLIDAHQPVYIEEELHLTRSIQQVTKDVIDALGLPKYLLSL